jgi:hypothetical protein
MDTWIIVGILAGLVIVATAIGLVARSRAGRVQEVRGFRVVRSVDLDTDELFGSAATFVQFSTEMLVQVPRTSL